ncbi:uncharacterized protein LOC115880827 [Sitophilus oryzae]|uniref:Uncharacterized protein LOC115880827 n=1 Tax=Sitophilus oryzae TaxID=7048 RepID=A0A6J2XR39_SITOR|nr:uncharacterized protein LOC115880827 [Sitophilus oryzae]
MNNSRLSYERPTYYSQNVLVGNWFEESVGKYTKKQCRHNTSYETDYIPKCPVDKEFNDTFRSDIQIKSEFGDNISPPKNTSQSQNYFDNYTTTYDLSYQYFPEWIQGTLTRKMRVALLKHEPTEEYLNSYGNLSIRSDMSKNKTHEWKCDVLDPRRTVLTTNQTDYKKYDSPYYKSHRWVKPTPIKVRCGNAVNLVFKQFPSNHPRNIWTKCNPITWECEQDRIPQEKCVCSS